MTTTRLVWIGIGNICLNLAMIRLLYHWQVSRRRAAYHDLCREARELCLQAEKLGDIEEKLVRREEVLL